MCPAETEAALCVEARKIARSQFWDLVTDEEVKKPNKQTFKVFFLYLRAFT